MTTSLWLMDNGFFAVRDSAFDTQPDTANWTRLARYDETLHPVLHQRLSDNVKNAVWENGQLTIDGQAVIDSAWIAARQAELNTAQLEAAQVNTAKTTLQNLTTGLHGLSAEEKGYAIYCRLLAYRNNANQQVIFGIVDRATAAAYVTSLPQWTSVPATSKPMLALMLETNAALTQVLLLVLSG